MAAWEAAGMKVPDAFRQFHHEAHTLFGRAASMQERPAEASAQANEAISKAFEAAELLTTSYTQQRLAVRRRRSARLPVSLGCNLGPASLRAEWEDEFCSAFSAATVPIEWHAIEPVEGEYDWDLNDAQVEWCLANKLMISGGPLLDFSSDGLPQWLAHWAHDFDNLKSFLCDFVETAVARYVGKIRLWEVSARVNTGGALGLSEEDRMALVAYTLDVAGQVDEEAQLLVRVDRPWGGYQARGQHRLSPLQFVDALIRCGTRLSGVNLEVCVGCRTHGTASRDLLEFSRMIDQWSILELPLYVTLGVPSAAAPAPDPSARFGMELEPSGWRQPWSESAQAEWIDLHLPLLMAKQCVVGIFWTHFTDAERHDFAHAGLLRPDGSQKPALEQFVKHGHAGWC